MVQRSIFSRIIWKLITAIILGALMYFGSGAVGFPPVYQWMFVAYVGLGFLVFLLLDAPPLPRLSGWPAGIALIGFYVLLSGVYFLGASAWPQFDPEVEKGKIEKLLKRKRERFMANQERTDALLQQVKILEDSSAKILARLNTFIPSVDSQAPTNLLGEGAMTVVDRGREVYELYECYNCHKIGGKGSVKKRGPALDNIGSFLTVEDIKRKVFDPTYLYAEGFEKQHKGGKGKMPDKYKELMTDEEVMALATFLATLKNPMADPPTPKPVFVKSNVEHGFIVFGYVRDAVGKSVSGIEVHVIPKKKGGHGAKGKTNDSGYYEIFIHMHNENSGDVLAVTVQKTTREFVAEYDPNDKVTKRQKALDLVIPAAS